MMKLTENPKKGTFEDWLNAHPEGSRRQAWEDGFQNGLNDGKTLGQTLHDFILLAGKLPNVKFQIDIPFEILKKEIQ